MSTPETIKKVNLNDHSVPIAEGLVVPRIIRSDFDTVFEQSKVKLRTVLERNKMEMNFPKMEEIDTALMPNKLSVAELSKLLQVPKRELYASIGEVENKFKTSVFNVLEKISQKNAKINDIIKLARDKYE